MAVLLAILLPLLGAAVMPALGRRLGARTGWVASAIALASALCVVTLVPAAGEPETHSWPWVPSLGLSLSFLVDGLSVFFGLVVSVMGVLVMVYGTFYLGHGARDHGRFYCYLLFFMATMLGTVFAGHLLLLFVFWELTGIASYLLIGFDHRSGQSRAGARMALLVTSATGLVMLAGVVLLGQLQGTMELPELLAGAPGDGAGVMNVVMLLVMVGAFGKSAQFPFHFWLPSAMAAPTPVSAYLHSATMVKLGVFLCARMFPVFHWCDWWLPLLTVVAFGTMLLGAVMAFLSVDLKAILAYSTVSQLGFLVGYYGMAPARGVDFDYLHILNHVFYKGGLFMVAGIVEHATGTRDIRQLGGLGRRAPLLAAIALVGCATMAGLPGTTGFVSKEYMLNEIFGALGEHQVLGWYALVLIVITTLIKVAFSVRIFHGVFLGAESGVVRRRFHAPPVGLLIPPLLLAAAAVFFGLFPPLLGQGLAVLEVDGLHNRTHGDLHLWHGITREFLTSLAVVTGGLLAYAVVSRTELDALRIPAVLRLDLAFERGLVGMGRLSAAVTRGLRSDRPLDYLPILVAFFAVTVGGTLVWVGAPELGSFGWGAPDALRGIIAALIVMTVSGVVVLPKLTAQLISLTVAGFLISFYYVLYRAPDLALTQLLVETVTLILVLLLLNRFPDSDSPREGEDARGLSVPRRVVNSILAVSVGGVMCGLVLFFGEGGAGGGAGPRVGGLILERSQPLAAGTNAVNTTLVDFRGLDTLGEIAVLLITTLGCLGLLMRYKRSRAEYRSGPLGPGGFGIEHDEHDEENEEEDSP